MDHMSETGGWLARLFDQGVYFTPQNVVDYIAGEKSGDKMQYIVSNPPFGSPKD